MGSPRRRVLFVVPSLEAGGAERVVTHLVRHLPESKFDPHIAMLSRTGALLAQIPPATPVHDLGVRRARHVGPSLLRLIWRLRPDVVFSTLRQTSCLLIALRPFLPRATTVIVRESVVPTAVIQHLGGGAVWKPLLRFIYPRAHAIVCPAQSVVEDLARNFGVPRERMRWIPNPVDRAAIEQATAEAPPAYAGAGPHLLAVGRLESQKGFDDLIEAFARISGQAHLWILGEGSKRQELAASAARLGIAERVHLQGRVSNPFPWMRFADLFVQSSRFEGSPNALLEALACGVRAVAFDEPGGTGEILDGLAGTALIPDRTTAALATAIKQMLGPDRPPPPHLPPRHALEVVTKAYEDVFLEANYRSTGT